MDYGLNGTVYASILASIARRSTCEDEFHRDMKLYRSDDYFYHHMIPLFSRVMVAYFLDSLHLINVKVRQNTCCSVNWMHPSSCCEGLPLKLGGASVSPDLHNNRLH
jgi:hypothetical protein